MKTSARNCFSETVNDEVVCRMSKKICKAVLVALMSSVALLLAPAAFAEGLEDPLFLYKGGRLHVLERVSSVSGERYEASGDPSTYFEAGGQESMSLCRGA